MKCSLHPHEDITQPPTSTCPSCHIAHINHLVALPRELARHEITFILGYIEQHLPVLAPGEEDIDIHLNLMHHALGCIIEEIE